MDPGPSGQAFVPDFRQAETICTWAGDGWRLHEGWHPETLGLKKFAI